jgi:curved DNA-binding protein CbpA
MMGRRMSNKMKDHYAVLGIARDADPDVVRAAYRALAKRLHPDAVAGNAETASRFREISDAYSVLSRAEQRAIYDQSISEVKTSHTPDPDFARAPAPAPRNALEKIQYGAAALLVFGLGGFIVLLFCAMAVGLIVGAMRP